MRTLGVAVLVSFVLAADGCGGSQSDVAKKSMRPGGRLVSGGKLHPTSGPVGAEAVQPGITTLGVDPFREGETSKLVTLQEFVADKAAQGYDVPLPDSPLANSTNVGSVWESSTGGAVVWYPASGIEVAYGGTGLDYSGLSSDEIQTINGVRAIVLSADNPESFGFSTVKLPIPNGHAITLLSKGSVSDLVSVAKTMSGNNSP